MPEFSATWTDAGIVICITGEVSRLDDELNLSETDGAAQMIVRSLTLLPAKLPERRSMKLQRPGLLWPGPDRGVA